MLAAKVCIRCLECLTLDNFYRHPKMADGHLNKCKPCARAEARHRQEVKRDEIRAYDKARANLPHRIAARTTYQRTESGKAAHARANDAWAQRNPERRHASHVVNNAVRDGKLMRLPCLVCGKRAQGHHPDYSRPLDVVWLCTTHHRAAHALVPREAA